VRNQRALPKGAVNGDSGHWWDTGKGIMDKGIELGMSAPANAEGPAFWEFTGLVWAKMGDGPWIDDKMQAYRYYKRAVNGGE
jgi:hypothetical protein